METGQSENGLPLINFLVKLSDLIFGQLIASGIGNGFRGGGVIEGVNRPVAGDLHEDTARDGGAVIQDVGLVLLAIFRRNQVDQLACGVETVRLSHDFAGLVAFIGRNFGIVRDIVHFLGRLDDGIHPVDFALRGRTAAVGFIDAGGCDFGIPIERIVGSVDHKGFVCGSVGVAALVIGFLNPVITAEHQGVFINVPFAIRVDLSRLLIPRLGIVTLQIVLIGQAILISELCGRRTAAGRTAGQAVNIERAIAAARMPTAARFIIRIIKIPPFVMVIGSFPKMSCRLTPSYPPGNPVSIAF